MDTTDRIKELMNQNQVTGVDFVYVHDNQVDLNVHFLKPPSSVGILLSEILMPEQVRLYSPGGAIPEVPVDIALWGTESGCGIFRAGLEGGNPRKIFEARTWHMRDFVWPLAQNKIYWTDPIHHCIRSSDKKGNNIKTLVTGLESPMGIAYHPTTNTLFWTDSVNHSIKSLDLKYGTVKTVVSQIGAPTMIVLHTSSSISQIYWTDPMAGRIWRANVNGKKVECLVKGLDAPFDIVFDHGPGIKKMYWTDPVAGKIYRANLSGKRLEVIAEGLDYPLGITLDNQLFGKIIYFTDPINQKIWQATIPSKIVKPLNYGQKIKPIITGKGIPFSIALRKSLKPAPFAKDKIYWTNFSGKEVLRLRTEFPGDFSTYRIYIDHPKIDPYYNNIAFSFKATCESDLDCEPPNHECLVEEVVDFPVDYQSRDYESYRRALLDFAAQRYPDWRDRKEADAGIMLAEVMSALGDEMAYYQDRIGREAHLETASQRRSLRRHARLVDYHLHDGLGASTWLNIFAKSGQTGEIPEGSHIWANSDSGHRIDFEVGKGMPKKNASEEIDFNYVVDYRLNSYDSHIWDDDDTCLFVGSIEMYVEVKEHQKNALTFNDFPQDTLPGRWVLLQTTSNPIRTHLVRLIHVEEMRDPLLQREIAHLVWEEEQALPFEMDLRNLKVCANLIPATAGKRFEAYFVTGKDPKDLDLPLPLQKTLDQVVERSGPNGSTAFLYSLPQTENNSLVWLGKTPQKARPEIQLTQVIFDEETGEWDEIAPPWNWKRSLLGTTSSLREDKDFMLDDGTWKRVVGYQRGGQEHVHKDYASNQGVTIRFGDGEFGMTPARGTIFHVTYRLGGGRRSNVAADSLTNFTEDLSDLIKTVTNPLPSINGTDPESPEEVRQLAPEAFRAVTYRAVKAEDYAEAAELLDWVQRAGASIRWTGSWLSAFVTPDPLKAVLVNDSQRMELVKQLNRFRQTGREVHVLDPCYADIDLEITICVHSNAFVGNVKERVFEALFGRRGIRPRPGYFSPDSFTFGSPLERSTLESVIQAVPGVRAVEKIRFRRRGWFDWKQFSDMYYPPGKETIIRVANDSLYPERGTVGLKMKGGA